MHARQICQPQMLQRDIPSLFRSLPSSHFAVCAATSEKVTAICRVLGRRGSTVGDVGDVILFVSTGVFWLMVDGDDAFDNWYQLLDLFRCPPWDRHTIVSMSGFDHEWFDDTNYRHEFTVVREDLLC
jgi:hypothetical protein